MGVFELVIGLLFVGGLLALLANRLRMPYPALLALVGMILALVPGAPDVRLDPELALVLFVAPTLLDAAYDASPRDLRRNVVPVLSLAVGMVIATVAAVASTVRVAVPEIGWAAAIALGAIVAPPDASAASAVLRRLSPPHRLLVILEGESLFNDATALLIYRAAVGAAITGAFSGWSILPMLLLTCVSGVIAGHVLAHILMRLLAAIEEVAIQVLFGFIATFGRLVARRRHRPVGDPDDGRLRDDPGAEPGRRGGRAYADDVVCRLGRRRPGPQRARVRPDRAAVAGHPRAYSCRRRANVCARGDGRVCSGDRRASRVDHVARHDRSLA